MRQTKQIKMKNLKLKDGIKEMLTKEQMKSIGGGNQCFTDCGISGSLYGQIGSGSCYPDQYTASMMCNYAYPEAGGGLVAGACNC